MVSSSVWNSGSSEVESVGMEPSAGCFSEATPSRAQA